MNILYCGDKGISRGILVSILSLMEHNSEPLEIYIMTIKYAGVEPFSGEYAKFLDRMVKGKLGVKKRGILGKLERGKSAGKGTAGGGAAELGRAVELEKVVEEVNRWGNAESFVRLVDATEAFVRWLPKKNMGSYFTPCSMLRLYADQMAEFSDLSRILYLDYDVVCRRSIAEFYHIDLSGVEAAGVLDIYGRHFYRYHGLFNEDYMNSGVMLFNLEECRRTGMFGKARKMCAERWMMLADQAALNKAIARRKLMPRRFNEQGERPREETVLHHFSNNFKFFPYFHVQKVKPFEVEKIHRVLGIWEYDDILEKYRELWENWGGKI